MSLHSSRDQTGDAGEPVSLLQRGRAAFQRRSWAAAYDALTAADGEQALGPEDLELLGTVAYLANHADESAQAWTRAHNEYLHRAGPGDRQRAARWACWLAFRLLIVGERARGGGWLARGSRLLGDCPPDCLERGYLLLPLAMTCALAGDAAGAQARFHEAVAVGERYGDRDLVAMALMGEGRSLIRLGVVEAGLTLLDEAMAAVDAREVSPVLVGDLYCSVISACREVFDLRRAQEWTTALSHWCETQPEIAPHRGECLVRRSEILRFHGAWPDAFADVRRACDLLPDQEDAVTGAAYYELAELHRLRGELDEAETAYRLTSNAGRSPHPGLSLLRLARGQSAAAAAGIRQALDEAAAPSSRATLLAAAVEIGLATNDIASARAAADELSSLAGRFDATYPQALATSAAGAIVLADGDAYAARQLLRAARALWQELGAPYDVARVRVLLGRACAALGEAEAAELELEAARAAFEQLGAGLDLAGLEGREETPRPSRARSGLTDRELGVLTLVAEGLTNREIAGRLYISEKTVARHLSNIFGKLNLSSRAAATAYAYRNSLLQGRG